MNKMLLKYFTEDQSFPFFIQFGAHEKELFMHSHKDFCELVIVLRGSAEHIVDNERYRISKGDVFIISNDTEHGYAETSDLRICNIMFKPSFWLASDYDVVKTAGFQALFILEPQYLKQNHFRSQLKLDVSEFINVFDILKGINKEYTQKAAGWQTLVKSEFLRLTVLLSRLYSFDEIGNNNVVHNLAKAISYIENNYTKGISINQLAKLSNYSKRQFIRIFKNNYNCIPMDYITRLRLENACLLLRLKENSITEIATMCGYNDSNYFSRIFKKHRGMTPTQYRVQNSK